MKKITLFISFVIIAFFLQSQSVFTSSTTISEVATKKMQSFYLPFYEDWSSASLEFNNWSTTSEHWKIFTLYGNEKPSVQFEWSPLLENDYSSTLESNTIDAENLLVGRIFLDFDLMLNNRNATGTEKILVEVFDGEVWTQVYEIRNDSSIDWDRYSVEITDQALGTNFKFRFNATGVNSFDIIYWLIDNIEVYRTCDAPYNLDGEFYWNAVDDWGTEIWWNAPESAIQEEHHWLHWDDGVNNTSIGLINGGDFSVAARWESEQLVEYLYDTLYSIRFFLDDDGFSELIVKIWTGENANTVIYQKIIANPLSESWNQHNLDTILLINPVTEYWVGYTILGQLPGSKPAGMDNGPAARGFGDMIRAGLGEWESITGFNFDHNFNIQMKLLNNNSGPSKCMGFNIYRLGTDENDYSLLDYESFVEDQNEYEYQDSEVDHLLSACYKVKAQWAEDGDTCESESAKAVIPIYDYLCFNFIPEAINETNSIKFTVSPNPAFNTLSINSESEIESVTILNLQGQVLHTENLNKQKESDISVESLTPGLYLLKVKTGAGVGVKKFLKQ